METPNFTLCKQAHDLGIDFEAEEYTHKDCKRIHENCYQAPTLDEILDWLPTLFG